MAYLCGTIKHKLQQGITLMAETRRVVGVSLNEEELAVAETLAAKTNRTLSALLRYALMKLAGKVE